MKKKKDKRVYYLNVHKNPECNWNHFNYHFHLGLRRTNISVAILLQKTKLLFFFCSSYQIFFVMHDSTQKKLQWVFMHFIFATIRVMHMKIIIWYWNANSGCADTFSGLTAYGYILKWSMQTSYRLQIWKMPQTSRNTKDFHKKSSTKTTESQFCALYLKHAKDIIISCGMTILPHNCREKIQNLFILILVFLQFENICGFN